MPNSEHRKAYRKIYMKQYFKENKQQLYANEKKRRPKYYEKHHQRCRGYAEKSFSSFLKKCLCSHKSWDRVKGRENNIDLDYLLDLLKIQNECCAGTGLKMTHILDDLRAVSIDRINSTKGHIKGNIQLVCQFYQFGKRHKSDIEARSIFLDVEMNLLKKLKAQGYLKIPKDVSGDQSCQKE